MRAADVTSGTVGILNVGAGDTKLSFDPANPAERIRAAGIVRDMLRRGYALLIEVEREGRKVFVRATDFLDDVCEYVIADFDPVAAADADAEVRHGQQDKTEAVDPPATAARAAPRIKRTTVKAERARAVAVAPSAGG